MGVQLGTSGNWRAGATSLTIVAFQLSHVGRSRSFEASGSTRCECRSDKEQAGAEKEKKSAVLRYWFI